MFLPRRSACLRRRSSWPATCASRCSCTVATRGRGSPRSSGEASAHGVPHTHTRHTHRAARLLWLRATGSRRHGRRRLTFPEHPTQLYFVGSRAFGSRAFFFHEPSALEPFFFLEPPAWQALLATARAGSGALLHWQRGRAEDLSRPGAVHRNHWVVRRHMTETCTFRFARPHFKTTEVAGHRIAGPC
jgi:hypothetical protein